MADNQYSFARRQLQFSPNCTTNSCQNRHAKEFWPQAQTRPKMRERSYKNFGFLKQHSAVSFFLTWARGTLSRLDEAFMTIQYCIVELQLL